MNLPCILSDLIGVVSFYIFCSLIFIQWIVHFLCRRTSIDRTVFNFYIFWCISYLSSYSWFFEICLASFLIIPIFFLSQQVPDELIFFLKKNKHYDILFFLKKKKRNGGEVPRLPLQNACNNNISASSFPFIAFSLTFSPTATHYSPFKFQTF